MAIPYRRCFHDGNGEIHLVGRIGTAEDSISADDFAAALHDVRRCNHLYVHIDSIGGNPRESWAMAKAIRDFPVESTAIITGACCSAAVDPFFACWHRTALAGSCLMLHRAVSKNAEFVEDDFRGMLRFYGSRTLPANCERWGSDLCASPAQLAAWIDSGGSEGTYFSADDLKQFGFIEAIYEPSEKFPLAREVDLTGRHRPTKYAPFVIRADGKDAQVEAAIVRRNHRKALAASTPASEPIQAEPDISFDLMATRRRIRQRTFRQEQRVKRSNQIKAYLIRNGRTVAQENAMLAAMAN